MSPGQTTIISLEKVVVPDTTTFLTIVLGDGDGPMVVVVVVYPEIVISPPTPIQLLTDGVIEGVIEGVGVIEAPRGTLIHHYKVDENDQVTYCNLIVSSTNNNEAMNRAVKKVAHDHISGKPEITEGMLNHVEVAVRSYDPCLSCATHALGQMPLVAELYDAEGKLIQTKSRNV